MVILYLLFFVFRQTTAYEMLIRDWSSDVCSSDLIQQLTRPSVAPYTSLIWSRPHHSIHACLSHGAIGAAVWTTFAQRERSWQARADGLSAMIRCIIVGTMSAQLAPSSSISPSAAIASNRSIVTIVDPVQSANIAALNGAL